MLDALDSLIRRTLNHLIEGEPWAQERLRPHAGSQALIQAGGLALYLVVGHDGLFQPGAPEQAVVVTVSLPADTPLRFLVDRKSIFQAAKLSGSVDFAETLAFVFRNLRWDAEADLARYIGDIPARRLDMLGSAMLKHGRESVARTFSNFAEYATEDSDYLVPQRDVEDFARAVDNLRDDLARLEKRLDRL